MPAGLDTPSSIGLTIAVIGPAFVAMKNAGMTPEAAGIKAWYLGMAGIIVIGIIKIAFVPIANKIQKIVPDARASWLTCCNLCRVNWIHSNCRVFSMPIVGLISLALIIYTLIAKFELPKNFLEFLLLYF